MKKLITSAGLVALGAAGVQAAGYMPSFSSTDMSRPWSVAASLRGFYDSNPYTAPKGSSMVQGSWGFELLVPLSVAYSTDTTDFGARATFGADYYAQRVDKNWDFSGQLDVVMNHSFSPRHSLFVADSLVLSSEPTVLDSNNPAGAPYRTDATNLRNNGSITFNAELTQVLTAVVGYANTLYIYQQDASDVATPVSGGNAIGGGSYSALLNRIENLALLNLRWQMLPDTVGVLGYQFGLVDFTGDEYLYAANSTAGVPKSDSRNNLSHYAYVGADHNFNPDFSGSLRVGAQYSDSYNIEPHYTFWNPYVDLNLTYRYGVGSRIQLGFQQVINQTFVLAANQSSSIVYASINHHFTQQLSATLLGEYQYSSYNSPSTLPANIPNYGGESANYFLAGISLSYQFNRYLSADVGYNFDALSSSSGALYDYNRNRVFFGVTARY